MQVVIYTENSFSTEEKDSLPRIRPGAWSDDIFCQGKRYTNPGIDELNSILPFTGNYSKEIMARIPQNIPNLELQLKAKASINGVGKDVCKQSIRVEK